MNYNYHKFDFALSHVSKTYSIIKINYLLHVIAQIKALQVLISLISCPKM